MNQFNLTRLWFLSIIIAAMGLSTYFDDDLGGLFFLLCGFVYSATLYYSLQVKPNVSRFIVGVVVLGQSNLFVFYSSIITLILPSEAARYAGYFLPSLLGAAITFIVLSRIWAIQINKKFVFFTLSLVGIASLLSKATLISFGSKEEAKGLWLSLNSVCWSLAFTSSVTICQQSANNALKSASQRSAGRRLGNCSVSTEMEATINKALSELARFQLPWQEMIREQLEYCLDVISGKSSHERLEDLNMGLIAVREIDETDVLYSLLTRIQYELQHKYLSYAAKMRLNIHRR